jgi:hypothetical protein
MALLPTQFRENLQSDSKAISGGHTGRQTGDLESLLSFLESRLIIRYEKRKIRVDIVATFVQQNGKLNWNFICS